MKKFALSLLVATLALPLTATAQLQPRVLRGDMASVANGRISLQAEPEDARIIATPMVFLDRVSQPPLAAEGMVLKVNATAKGQAELELQAVYNQDTPYVMPRRTVTEEPLLWNLYNSDVITSFTLAARGGDVSVNDYQLLGIGELTLPERIRSFMEQPLRPLSSVQPIRNELLALQFAFPEDIRSDLARLDLELSVSDASGEAAREAVSVSLTQKQKDIAGDFWTIRMKRPVTGEFRIELASVGDQGKEIIASSTFAAERATGPYYEIPLRSIEDVDVLAKNGELVLYACAGDVGVGRGASDVQLPAEVVYVAAGNGVEWPLMEPALRTRRDVVWMNGGPHSLSTIIDGGVAHTMYTTAFSDGREALNYATAVNSLKVLPVASNPIWEPEAPSEWEAPMIRGNAQFLFNDTRLLVTMLKHPGKPAQPQAFLSAGRSRWNDLGPLPLPNLKKENYWLTSYRDDESYYLIAGPDPQLFRADHPLRGWEEAPLTAFEGWEKLHLVQWDGRTWLFGIKRVNGCGVIAWGPVERDGQGFAAVPEFTFTPPSLRTVPPPAPMPERSETNVR